MTAFVAVENSTIYDVCLNTYGSLNHLTKLMVDNNHPGVDENPKAGQVFMFDETLIANQIIYAKGIKYATA